MVSRPRFERRFIVTYGREELDSPLAGGQVGGVDTRELNSLLSPPTPASRIPAARRRLHPHPKPTSPTIALRRRLPQIGLAGPRPPKPTNPSKATRQQKPGSVAPVKGRAARVQQRPAQRRTAKGRKRLANAAKSGGETHGKRAAKRSTAAAGKHRATALPESAAAAAKNEAKSEANAQAKIAATRRNCTRQQPGCFAVERAPAGEAGNGKRTRLSGGGCLAFGAQSAQNTTRPFAYASKVPAVGMGNAKGWDSIRGAVCSYSIR